MPRGVYKVECIFCTIMQVFHLYGMALDCDASLFFEVHIVKHLSFGYFYRVGMFQQTVGQGRFAMVYMGYDAKVSCILHLL